MAEAPDPLRIRKATVEDARAISELLVDLSERFITPEFPAHGRRHFLRELAPDRITARIESGFSFHVARSNTEMAGVAAVRGDSHLYYLFVAERFQRLGLARRLWKVASAAWMQGSRNPPFTVNASTYAVPIYERLGFVRAGRPREADGVIFHPMAFHDAGGSQQDD